MRLRRLPRWEAFAFSHIQIEGVVAAEIAFALGEYEIFPSTLDIDTSSSFYISVKFCVIDVGESGIFGSKWLRRCFLRRGCSLLFEEHRC